MSSLDCMLYGSRRQQEREAIIMAKKEWENYNIKE